VSNGIGGECRATSPAWAGPPYPAAMSRPELLTNLDVNDALRDAERLHRVAIVLNQRSAIRYELLSLNLERFWQGFEARASGCELEA